LLPPALQAGLDQVAGGEREGLGWPVILGLDGAGLVRKLAMGTIKTSWSGM
jgi:hypothetical protein